MCRRLRSECGVTQVNPSHPKLRALLAAGAEWPEFAAAAQASEGKDGRFAYLLTVVENERRRAAQMAPALHHGPMPTPMPGRPEPRSFAQQDREAGMARWEQMTGQRHPDRDRGTAPLPVVIDVAAVPHNAPQLEARNG